MDPKAIAKLAFPSYRGRKIRANLSGRITFYDTNWSGGTRNEYVAIRLEDMASRHSTFSAPWVNPYEGTSTDIPKGFAIVEHSISCGKDMGCTVYLNTQETIA